MEPERIKVMRFAENNRISHRQLFRQIILVFPAPFLLCLFKNGAMLGISAMAGTAAAAVVLSFYVIWLIRLTPAYGELSKRTGSFTVRFIGLFFLVYVIASSAFLSGLLGEVIPESLISGIPENGCLFLQLQPVVWERIAECREEGGSLRCPEGFFWQGSFF